MPTVGAGASRPLLDVLGVRTGQKTALIGVSGQYLRSAASQPPVHTSASGPLRPVDVIVYQVANAFGLRRVRELAPLVKDGGALWVLWPRSETHITQNHVQRSGLAAGLIDVATVGVSDQVTGLKFIRGRRAR